MKKNCYFCDILAPQNARVLLLFVLCFFITCLYINMSNNLNKYNNLSKFIPGKSYEMKGIIDSVSYKENYVELLVIPGVKKSYIAKEKVLLRVYEENYEGEKPDEKYINWLCNFKFIYKKLDKASNYGNFDSEDYYNSLGIAGVYECNKISVIKSGNTLNTYIIRAREYMKGNILKFMGGKYGSIMCAIVLGEKTSMDEETKELYSRNGLAHILAVSGLHIATVGMILYNLLRRFMSVRIGAVISIIIVFLYGIITGGSVSCMRALIMFIIRMSALVLGRKNNIYMSIFLSASIILIINPFYIKNSSFIMSYVAITAVTVIMPEVSFLIEKSKNKYLYLFKPVITGVILNITMLPLVCFYYYEVSLLSVFLNLLVVPLMTVVLTSGIICGISGDVLNMSGFVSGFVGKVFLWFFEKLCDVADMVPKSVVVTGKPLIMEIILFYVIIIISCVILCRIRIIIRRKESKKLKNLKIIAGLGAWTIVLFISILSIVLNNHITGKGLFISFLDVGQGDCIFVKDDVGKTYLIDCGSSSLDKVGEYRLSSHIKALGTGDVDYVFVTHGDLDHISGIKEILEDEKLLKVKNLVIAQCQKEDDSIKELRELAAEKNINVIYIKKGTNIKSGKLNMECIYPDARSGTDSNDNSLVLLIRYENFKILFTGDIGTEVEEVLIESYPLEIKDIDILKVAHHGSKNSSSKNFLSLTKPNASIISCSENNSYGHPHNETIERLKDVGSSVFMTKDRGSIMMRIEGDVEICEFK